MGLIVKVKIQNQVSRGQPGYSRLPSSPIVPQWQLVLRSATKAFPIQQLMSVATGQPVKKARGPQRVLKLQRHTRRTPSPRSSYTSG